MLHLHKSSLQAGRCQFCGSFTDKKIQGRNCCTACLPAGCIVYSDDDDRVRPYIYEPDRSVSSWESHLRFRRLMKRMHPTCRLLDAGSYGLTYIPFFCKN